MKIDERDIIFSRMSYKIGSQEYIDYYSKHPDLKEKDDILRALPNLGSKQSPTYNAYISPVVDGLFALMNKMHPLIDGEVNQQRLNGNADDFTPWIKNIALELGASASGIIALTPEHYYSNRGRNCQVYGEEITKHLPFGLVFAVPMNPNLLRSAPKAPEMLATVFGYLEAAKISLALAATIRECGYQARAHIDGHYLMPLRRLAYEAGLGAIGKNALIITEKHGPCVRLGAIDTDMPLNTDNKHPKEHNISEFCKICGRCTLVCNAINKKNDKPSEYNCYKMWRKIGTDCGACINACPFTNITDWSRLETEESRKNLMAELNKASHKKFTSEPLSWLPNN